MMARMMTMTNERKIWEAALLLVRRHGAAAAEIAQRKVALLQRLTDNDHERLVLRTDGLGEQPNALVPGEPSIDHDGRAAAC